MHPQLGFVGHPKSVRERARSHNITSEGCGVNAAGRNRTTFSESEIQSAASVARAERSQVPGESRVAVVFSSRPSRLFPYPGHDFSLTRCSSWMDNVTGGVGKPHLCARLESSVQPEDWKKPIQATRGDEGVRASCASLRRGTRGGLSRVEAARRVSGAIAPEESEQNQRRHIMTRRPHSAAGAATGGSALRTGLSDQLGRSTHRRWGAGALAGLVALCRLARARAAGARGAGDLGRAGQRGVHR